MYELNFKKKEDLFTRFDTQNNKAYAQLHGD